MWGCLDMVWRSVRSNPTTGEQLCAWVFWCPCYQVRAATLEAKVQQITCVSREAAAALHLDILSLSHTILGKKHSWKLPADSHFDIIPLFHYSFNVCICRIYMIYYSIIYIYIYIIFLLCINKCLLTNMLPMTMLTWYLLALLLLISTVVYHVYMLIIANRQ